MTGLDMKEHYLDELAPADVDESWMDEYELAYGTRQPVMEISAIKTSSDLRFVYEFGVFALSKGGTCVEQFLALRITSSSHTSSQNCQRRAPPRCVRLTQVAGARRREQRAPGRVRPACHPKPRRST